MKLDNVCAMLLSDIPFVGMEDFYRELVGFGYYRQKVQAAVGEDGILHILDEPQWHAEDHWGWLRGFGVCDEHGALLAWYPAYPKKFIYKGDSVRLLRTKEQLSLA